MYEKLYEFLREQLASIDSAKVGLPGGTSPKPLYEIMNEKKDQEVITAHYYQVDERYVPFFSPESNMLGIMDVLDDDFTVSGWDTEISTREESNKDYAELIGENTVLDICVLGMGDDGHVASVFPNSRAITDENMLAIAQAPNAPRDRVTMTLPYLMKSKTLILIVNTPKKRALLQRIQDFEGNVIGLPVSLLMNHNNLHIFALE